MTRFIILSAILCASFITKAQRNLFSEAPVPKTLLPKNEIGITLNPVIGFLFSGPQQQNRFEITYKRVLNEKSALRSSLGIDYSRHRSSSHFTSNKLTEDNSSSTNSNVPFIKIGYERRFGGRKKLDFYYGADILIGYYRSKTSTSVTRTLNDSLFSEFNSVLTEEITTENAFKLGLSPFIGARYNFSKVLSVSVQAGLDFNYQLGQRTVTTGNTVTKTPINTFKTKNIPKFFSDVSLLYKF